MDFYVPPPPRWGDDRYAPGAGKEGIAQLYRSTPMGGPVREAGFALPQGGDRQAAGMALGSPVASGGRGFVGFNDQGARAGYDARAKAAQEMFAERTRMSREAEADAIEAEARKASMPAQSPGRAPAVAAAPLPDADSYRNNVATNGDPMPQWQGGGEWKMPTPAPDSERPPWMSRETWEFQQALRRK